MNKGWTLERRMQQAEAIRQWKPWHQSTGPRTIKGKMKVAGNAYKGGHWRLARLLLQTLRKAMLHHKETIKDITHT